jgi:hypothetical protein
LRPLVGCGIARFDAGAPCRIAATRIIGISFFERLEYEDCARGNDGDLQVGEICRRRDRDSTTDERNFLGSTCF